jgi:phosphate transport system substrate-binding protein
MVVVVLTGVGSESAGVLIKAAGATFPYPIYSKWFDVYAQANSGVHISYEAIGSAAGIAKLLERTVDIGASDAPMTEQETKLVRAKILHFPSVMGAVVIAYNLPGLTTAVKLTGPVIADIFMGKIAKWNDPAIARLNQGVNLPERNITTCHRSDASGTTYVLADYLSKVSSEWASAMGKSKSLEWRGGVGAKGNAGVTAAVRQTGGAIGYIELTYALNDRIPFAELQNREGKWITATLDGVSAAGAAMASNMPADFRVSIIDPPGADSYPICSFTWLLVYQQQLDKTKGEQVVKFLTWALHDGQQYPAANEYAPIPSAIVALEDKQIREIQLPK